MNSENQPLRILSIGNSFADDQEAYVSPMALAAGKTILVANAYIGGCSFRRHLEEWEEDGRDYHYRENGVTIDKSASLREILAKRKWDFVTFQSGVEGRSYVIPIQPYLSRLIRIVRDAQPEAALAYSLTWADAEDSTRRFFRFAFSGDREKQFAHWQKDAAEAKESGIPYLIPVGLAFRRAYSEFGPRLYRDGYHSSELGRYLHACVWFPFFTGQKVPEDFLPAGETYEGGIAPTKEECARLRFYAAGVLEETSPTPGKH